MRYNLVLQFQANDIVDYDKLVEIEELLIKYLRGLSHVDGHDSGSCEMNIFILTNEPKDAFEKAKVIMKAAGLLAGLSAAYRLSSGEEYTRLWPIASTERFEVA